MTDDALGSLEQAACGGLLALRRALGVLSQAGDAQDGGASVGAAYRLVLAEGDALSLALSKLAARYAARPPAAAPVPLAQGEPFDLVAAMRALGQIRDLRSGHYRQCTGCGGIAISRLQPTA